MMTLNQYAKNRAACPTLCGVSLVKSSLKYRGSVKSFFVLDCLIPLVRRPQTKSLKGDPFNLIESLHRELIPT